jgi:hypothetical protein
VSRSAAFGDDLDRWLTPFLEAMGRSTRRRWGPVYLRGLLGPDGPKSVQPIAMRLGLRGHDQLHHFISSPAWDDAPLWRVLAEQADGVVGGDDALLVVDDTALPKKGTRSVGVAPQYCGALGKQANCQSLVSLTLARGEVPVPVGAVPPRPERAWPGLVGGRPTHAEGVHYRRRAAVPACGPRKATPARRAKRKGARRRGRASRLPLAARYLAPGQQRRARRPVRGRARAGCRRAAQSASRPFARRGGLVDRRMAQ